LRLPVRSGRAIVASCDFPFDHYYDDLSVRELPEFRERINASDFLVRGVFVSPDTAPFSL
jgi:hypothetical protein